MTKSLEQRIAGFLLKRLDRLQRLDLLEAASCAGLLDQQPLVPGEPEDGTKWIATGAAVSVPADRRQFQKLLAAGYGSVVATRKQRAGYDQFSDDEYASHAPAETHSHWNAATTVSSRPTDNSAVLHALIKQASPPVPAAIAVALLVARGLAKTFLTLADLIDLFRSPAPSLLVRAPVGGFERHAGELLDEGCLLPFWCKNVDIFDRMPLTPDRSHRRAGKRRRHVHTASGRGVQGALNERGLQKIEAALRGSNSPFVIIDETSASAQLPLLALADAVIECGALDHDLMARVISLALDMPVEEVSAAIEQLDVSTLALDDLNLAIKPGRSLDASVNALAYLAAHRRKDVEDGNTETEGKPKKNTRDKKPAADAQSVTDVTVIQPVAPTDTDTDRHSVPLVETLAGYGQAKAWALDLRTDLALWRHGEIPWGDLSSKLLLSGPPGTGKTLFATALCNSLQLPMIATSVADWLEPGYLGDVLKVMTDVFKAAEKHAPCILFIDELDNIGSRNKSAGSRHDDYWISLVNRLLVLLDGSLKTQGVVVIGATNRPEAIDPALLRSGRLETHILIELPDVSTLAEILKHHLSSDLVSVLSTRPHYDPAPDTAGTSDPNLIWPTDEGSPSSFEVIEQISKGERA